MQYAFLPLLNLVRLTMLLCFGDGGGGEETIQHEAPITMLLSNFVTSAQDSVEN